MGEMSSNIALICGAIAFVICYFKLFLYGKSKKQKFIERAKEKGNYVVGRLVDKKYVCGNRDSDNPDYKFKRYRVKYEYTVNGKSYKKILEFASQGRISVQYPNEVVVYYDSANPKKGVCREEACQEAQRSAGCVGTILVAVVVFEVVYNLLKLF